MISYLQLYSDRNPSIDTLIVGIPTDEAVEWCSYIVFRKDRLKIGENDLNILGPLLFGFESELQHKITDYLDGFYNGVDCLIDRYSFLRLIEFLISLHNDEHHELTKDEKTRLFKAYLDNNVLVDIEAGKARDYNYVIIKIYAIVVNREVKRKNK